MNNLYMPRIFKIEPVCVYNALCFVAQVYNSASLSRITCLFNMNATRTQTIRNPDVGAIAVPLVPPYYD